VIPDPLLTGNPYKRQMLVTVSTSHMERSIKSKVSLLLDRRHWLKQQLNIQVIGNTGRTWKVCCLTLNPLHHSVATAYFLFAFSCDEADRS